MRFQDLTPEQKNELTSFLRGLAIGLDSNLQTSLLSLLEFVEEKARATPAPTSFQDTLRKAKWAITHGPAMLRDEERRTTVTASGAKFVRPYDTESFELHARIGWPEMAR